MLEQNQGITSNDNYFRDCVIEKSIIYFSILYEHCILFSH